MPLRAHSDICRARLTAALRSERNPRYLKAKERGGVEPTEPEPRVARANPFWTSTMFLEFLYTMYIEDISISVLRALVASGRGGAPFPTLGRHSIQGGSIIEVFRVTFSKSHSYLQHWLKKKRHFADFEAVPVCSICRPLGL